MPRTSADDLFDLLPPFYRERDGDSGGALRGLLEVIARELTVIDVGLDHFEDDQYVETVSAEGVAGLGQLIGYLPLPVATSAVSARADLANTIHYRRRKGTPLLLERLARDVTGWPATIDETFLHLVWTQHLRHARPGAAGTTRISGRVGFETFDTPFDRSPRIPDARRITGGADGSKTVLPVGGPGAPRWSVPSLALRLFVDRPVAAEDVALVADPADAHRLRFDLLGRDRPLFTRSREVPDDAAVAARELPWPMTREALRDERPHHYGWNGSLRLRWSDGEQVPPDRVLVADLSDVPGGWAHKAPAGSYAVDPVLGRLVVGRLRAGKHLVADSYDARPQVAGAGQGRERAVDPQDPEGTIMPGDDVGAAASAVLGTVGGNDLRSVLVRGEALFPIGTSLPSAPGLALALVGAVDTRPVLLARGTVSVCAQPGSTTLLEGVMVAGGPLVIQDGGDLEPRTLELTDCTLVPGLGARADGTPTHPGTASIVVAHPLAEVRLVRCIVGPIIAVPGARVVLEDCVVDAADAAAVAFAGMDAGATGPITTLAQAEVGDGAETGGDLCTQGATIVGRVHARTLTASDTLFRARLPQPAPARWPAPVWIRRRQEGCVRFSFLPPDARVPRRFRCCDDADVRTAPAFWSLTFEASRYGLLHPSTPPAIRRGASDGGEIGASNHLQITHRETNLSARLQEYLRYGLEAGFSYA